MKRMNYDVSVIGAGIACFLVQPKYKIFFEKHTIKYITELFYSKGKIFSPSLTNEQIGWKEIL